MSPNRRAFWRDLAITTLVLLTCAAFLAFKPSWLKLPSCPWRTLTGLYCPGCGSTRALTRLVHGDVWGTFRYNLMTTPALLAVAYLWFERMRSLWTGKPGSARASVVIGFAVFAAFTIFAILRNVPWEGFDCLRPA